MKPQSKKYLWKRRQIEELIKQIEIEVDGDECYHNVYIDSPKSTRLAEKILSKFGINKPSEIKY